MLSCGEGGVRGGISSGFLGEEAATAEARDQLLAAEELLPISPYISLSLPISPYISLYQARDQLLAAEELLPWGCVEPSWGARRYDWLARLHGEP